MTTNPPLPHPPWPSRDAYDAALLDGAHTLRDPQLAQGKLARDDIGIIRYGGAGLYVAVYRIGDWLVRCFRSNPPADIRERYAAIAGFVTAQAPHCSALIPISYQPEGILVQGAWWPVVKMPFLQSVTSLGRYIERHHHQPAAMQALGWAWLRLITEMEAVQMAHGDLDLTNVLVEDRHGDLLLRLIDYDNLWIADLAERQQTEHGHEHFQHPAFLPPHARPYVAEMDRFSSLVIYLSLLALSREPALYETWQADDSAYLLLLRSDYAQSDRPDGRIAYLRNLPGLAPYVDALRDALRNGTMPPSIVQMATPIAPQPTQAPPPPLIKRSLRGPVGLRPGVMSFNTGTAATHPPQAASPSGRRSAPPFPHAMPNPAPTSSPYQAPPHSWTPDPRTFGWPANQSLTPPPPPAPPPGALSEPYQAPVSDVGWLHANRGVPARPGPRQMNSAVTLLLLLGFVIALLVLGVMVWQHR